ncbi:unnamed protein product [Auanema sp. JU1783]|nr:unnamed protein product [Auanema sp. JU1783]
MDDRKDDDVVEDIDERRLHRKAYEYLCRLLEVRSWLIDCLQDESVATVTDLEENFRNGVILARLSNFFASNLVPTKAIYDISQEKYENNEHIPVYRHTDNIMLWINAMRSVHLPEIFIPETVDVFEGRNIKTIFCLYALATLLYRLRKAPRMRNLAGKAVFTQNELDEMKVKVNESKLPEFGDVDGFLSNMTTDEKAVAIAIQKINKEIDNQDAEQLLTALHDADAGILHVEKDLSDGYLKNLVKAKKPNEMLSKQEIQLIISETNNVYAIDEINLLMENQSSDSKKLLYLLDLLQFEQTREFAIPLYLSTISFKKSSENKKLNRNELIELLTIANALAEVKLFVQQGSSADVFNALQNPCLQLKPKEENAKLYYNRLRYLYEKTEPEFFLNRSELDNVIFEFENLTAEHRNVMELKSSLERNEYEIIKEILRQICGSNYIEENFEYYLNKLNQNPPQSSEDVVKGVKLVNEKTVEAFARADAVLRLNKAIKKHNSSKIRLNLTGLVTSTDFSNYRQELIFWYVNRLIAEGDIRKKDELPAVADELWICEQFSYGYVYVETTELIKTTTRRHNIDASIINSKQIQNIIDDENANFEKHYEDEEDKVRKSQQILRRYLRNKKNKEALAEQLRQDDAAKKIQHNYKKYKDRQDQNKLRSEDNPSLELVRKFVGALQNWEDDLVQELDLEHLKSKVWHLRVSNQQLDGSLQDLDTKIGLLVRNRLNLQDVIEHKNKISDQNDNFRTRPASIRKKARDQQEKLEQLMYHLQADSAYLANLIQSDERRDFDGVNIISDCIAPIFGFITDKREEFLLVKLLCELILRNVEKSSSSDGILSSKDIPFMKSVLTNDMLSVSDQDPTTAIKEVIETVAKVNENFAFNLNPRTILADTRDDIPIEELLNKPIVKEVLDNSISFLSEKSEKIVDALIQNYKFPKRILYLTAYLNDILIRQFPTTSRSELDRIISVFIFECYFHPLLISKKSIQRSAKIDLNETSTHALEALIQFIGFGIKNRGYGNSQYYLSVLNKDIHIINEKFTSFVRKQVDNITFEDIYGLNEFTHFDPAHKPTLCLKEKQLTTILKYLKLNAPVIIPGTGMQLHNLIANCSAPTRLTDEKYIALQLQPMRGLDENRTAKQEIFIKTKKFVVDLLLSGLPGSSVEELIAAEPSDEVLKAYNSFYNPEHISLKEKQALIEKGLRELHTIGRTSFTDGHQSIVTDIANDVRLTTRRRKERGDLKKCLLQTEEKLEAQREELSSRLQDYAQYLDTCLDNLGRTAKRMSFRPNTEVAGKLQKERLSSGNYTVRETNLDKLIKKKVVSSVNLPDQKKLGKLTVRLSQTDKKGYFQMDICDHKNVVKSLVFDFQDILSKEAVEDDIWIDNTIEFNIINLKNYINRKFFSK